MVTGQLMSISNHCCARKLTITIVGTAQGSIAPKKKPRQSGAFLSNSTSDYLTPCINLLIRGANVKYAAPAPKPIQNNIM